MAGSAVLNFRLEAPLFGEPGVLAQLALSAWLLTKGFARQADAASQ